MEGTDMNSMPSLTLTERIAEVCASLISELGEKPLDKDAVSQRCEGGVSFECPKKFSFVNESWDS